MRFYERYTGFWRRLKWVYFLYNLSNYRYLLGNRERYRKVGLKRSVLRSLHSELFKGLVPPERQRNWDDKGFEVLHAVFSQEEVDELNAEIQQRLDEGQIGFNYTGRKIHFGHEKVKGMKYFMYHPQIMERLRYRMGREVKPFQSILFHYGSEQRAHSDSIHMSTFPQGGLIAAWIALEDVDEHNGALFYYPGSHRLPYATNKEIGASTSWILSANPNRLYEDWVERQISERGLQREVFPARKGDVLIWHGNLLHGGLPHVDMTRTRKSMVVHYFEEGDICYHEISQRPAVVKPI